MHEPARITLRHSFRGASRRVEAAGLDLDFTLTEPWTVLFGPSGAGKTTVLRAIAGLSRMQHARIVVAGEVLEDTAARVRVPAHRRPVRWSGQQSTLFPHLSVRENVAFGVSVQRAELDRALEHFQLHPLADKRPAELSGGQQQKVALVRAAIGARGKLLLLDEPFAGLDATVRGATILQLQQWLEQTPVLSVTHDVGEAFLLRAQVLRISEGRIAAQGPVAEMLAEERAHLRGILG